VDPRGRGGRRVVGQFVSVRSGDPDDAHRRRRIQGNEIHVDPRARVRVEDVERPGLGGGAGERLPRREPPRGVEPVVPRRCALGSHVDPVEPRRAGSEGEHARGVALAPQVGSEIDLHAVRAEEAHVRLHAARPAHEDRDRGVLGHADSQRVELPRRADRPVHRGAVRDLHVERAAVARPGRPRGGERECDRDRERDEATVRTASWRPLRHGVRVSPALALAGRSKSPRRRRESPVPPRAA
jgi:hypothetical protein